jgi:hypothetical protein
MTLVRRCSLLSVLLLIVLPASALADHGIRDELKCFSPEGHDEAEKIINQLHDRTDKDLLIETINDLSPEDRTKLDSHKNHTDRTRFFRDLAARRAEESKVDGVYVLLYHLKPKAETSTGGFMDRVRSRVAKTLDVEPSGRVVLVVPPENESLFPEEDRARLDKDFGNLRPDDPAADRVLLSEVRFVRDTIEKNVTAGLTPGAHSFHWTSVLWAGITVLGLWALLGVLRKRVLARQGLEHEPPAGAGAGPGTLFGASAGLWLYEIWKNSGSEAVDSESKTEAGKPEAPPA